jgi:hypothetical protein
MNMWIQQGFTREINLGKQVEWRQEVEIALEQDR